MAHQYLFYIDYHSLFLKINFHLENLQYFILIIWNTWTFSDKSFSRKCALILYICSSHILADFPIWVYILEAYLTLIAYNIWILRTEYIYMYLCICIYMQYTHVKHECIYIYIYTFNICVFSNVLNYIKLEKLIIVFQYLYFNL